MELSENDQKMVAYLRKQHEAWPVTRWIILISSILAVVATAGGWIKETAYYIFALYGLSYSLGRWSGRPEISLLLRLAETKENNV